MPQSAFCFGLEDASERRMRLHGSRDDWFGGLLPRAFTLIIGSLNLLRTLLGLLFSVGFATHQSQVYGLEKTWEEKEKKKKEKGLEKYALSLTPLELKIILTRIRCNKCTTFKTDATCI